MTASMVALIFVSVLAPTAQPKARPIAEPEPRTWRVQEVERRGLVAVPEAAASQPRPVVFVFHGHGGTARHAARTMNYHTHWPEAIVVYLQGLPTPGKLTDPEGKKSGWQHAAGEQNDRDLKFFDEVLRHLKSDYRVDEARIYATGHSNGGGFTYLLWSERGEHFAAVAPSGAVARPQHHKLQPKPVLHIAGEQDELVKFEWQQRGIDWLKKVNGCDSPSQPWGEHRHARLYPSNTGCPLVTYIHPGGHEFPGKEVVPLVVAFFKEHARSTSGQPNAAARE